MTATRVLPGRLFGPRILAPRLRGAESAAVVQTATHLVLTTQPGGAVSGVPLTIQPAGQALDALNALVTGFGGTITAVVSSGTATISAGGSVVASAGAFAFTDLTLVGSGLVTITLQSDPLTSITSMAFLLSAAPVAGVTLVESPTFVRRMQRVGTAGETLSIVGEQFLGRDRLTVQSLPAGTVVTLTMDPPDGGTPLLDAVACTVDSEANTVGYVGVVPSTVGTCQYQFHMTLPNGGGDLYFPDGRYATLTVIPPVA